MELIQLKYFLAIVEEGTMLQAAETLHVSQSTLSMAMKRLEAELGFGLFRRVGRRLYPTEDGMRFYSGTARILGELEDLAQQCRAQARRAGVAVAVEAVDFSVEALSRYSGIWPDDSIRQVRSTRNMTHQLLRSGQVDFCITAVDDTGAGFQVERILSEPMELLVSREHPLAARESVSLAELKDETFIVIKPEYAHRLSIERMCEENGFQMRHIYELHDEEALTVMVSRGMGVTFIPESIINMHGPTTMVLPPQTVPLKITDAALMRHVYLTALPNKQFGEPARRLLDYLRRYAAAVAQARAMLSMEETRAFFHTDEGCLANR